MTKFLKAKTIVLFVLSTLFLTGETLLMIQLYREIDYGGVWTVIGFGMVSMPLFFVRGLLLIFSAFNFFKVSDIDTKSKFYYFAMTAAIIFALLALISLIINFMFFGVRH